MVIPLAVEKKKSVNSTEIANVDRVKLSIYDEKWFCGLRGAAGGNPRVSPAPPAFARAGSAAPPPPGRTARAAPAPSAPPWGTAVGPSRRSPRQGTLLLCVVRGARHSLPTILAKIRVPPPPKPRTTRFFIMLSSLQEKSRKPHIKISSAVRHMSVK